MPQLTLDKTDIKILQVLQENGRLTNVELSERVALSPSPCLRRLKQLEDAGIVRQYAALLSPESVNLGLQAFIRVSIRKAKDAREDFAASVRKWPEVLSCFALTGETDYLLQAIFYRYERVFPFCFGYAFIPPRRTGCAIELCFKRNQTHHLPAAQPPAEGIVPFPIFPHVHSANTFT